MKSSKIGKRLEKFDFYFCGVFFDFFVFPGFFCCFFWTAINKN